MKQNAICSPIGQSLGATINIIIKIGVIIEESRSVLGVTFTNQFLTVEYVKILSGMPKYNRGASSAASMTCFIYAFMLLYIFRFIGVNI
jgi:hypothetical protein